MDYSILLIFVLFVGFIFLIVGVLVYTTSEVDSDALKNKLKKEKAENILDDDLD